MLLLVPRGLMGKDEVRQEHHEHTGDFYRMGMCSRPRILNQTQCHELWKLEESFECRALPSVSELRKEEAEWLRASRCLHSE